MVLPAHATTSQVALSARYSLTQNFPVITRANEQNTGQRYAQGEPTGIVDLLVPKAHAISQQALSQMVLIGRSGGTYDFYVLDSLLSFDQFLSKGSYEF